MKVYLHQFLTGSGAFKGKSEVYGALREGEITVDGKVVVNPLHQIKPGRKRVLWKGVPLDSRGKMYIVMNKPVGFLCSRLTSSDRRLGKKSVFDLLGREIDVGMRNSLFSVGRLDEDTSGLLLLTNDGRLCSRITSPRGRVEKTYLAVLERPLSREEARRLEAGVVIDLEENGRVVGYRTRGCSVTFLSGDRSRLHVTVVEGRKREVRRMFESVGNNVVKLERVSIGGLRLRGLGLRRGGYVVSNREFVEERVFDEGR